MDEVRIPPSEAGDPFTVESHPHCCWEGYVFLGYTALDEQTGEEVECSEALPCRRCADSRR